MDAPEEDGGGGDRFRRPTLLSDLDLLALSRILSAVPDPAAAAAAAASCAQCARVDPGEALWRALQVDARAVPDTRAAPRGARTPLILLAPPAPRAPRAHTRAAAVEVTRWLSVGRGQAAQSLSLAWHPAVAASAAAAEAALAGCTSARFSALHLDAGPAGALAALPKPLTGACRPALASLSIVAASMDAGALSDASGGPPPAFRALECLSIRAALTGWAALLPPPGRSGGRGGGWGPGALARLRSLELIGSGLREVPPALVGASSLTRLVLVGARLGRDRWSAAATGASSAWSPTSPLASVGETLVELRLEDCGLETVPAEVAGCARLVAACFARNALRSFSCAALAGLPALRLVDVEENALGAPLPAGLVGTWGEGWR